MTETPVRADFCSASVLTSAKSNWQLRKDVSMHVIFLCSGGFEGNLEKFRAGTPEPPNLDGLS